jgi:U4/U6.U5 tri-snRNP-associated protein 3
LSFCRDSRSPSPARARDWDGGVETWDEKRHTGTRDDRDTKERATRRDDRARDRDLGGRDGERDYHRGDRLTSDRERQAQRDRERERAKSPLADGTRDGGDQARTEGSGAAPPRDDDRFQDDDEHDSGNAPPLPREAPPEVPDTGPSFNIPEGMEDEEAMALFMGFDSFNTTHGKAIEDNKSTAAKGAARRVLKREYRQYMNRKGGFSRPLDPQKPISH